MTTSLKGYSILNTWNIRKTETKRMSGKAIYAKSCYETVVLEKLVTHEMIDAHLSKGVAGCLLLLLEVHTISIL